MAKKKEKKQKTAELVTLDSKTPSALPAEREGYFKEGFDKLGRPYEKKVDSTGLYSKKEILKDGTYKLTLKKKP